jgi:hypothetical protein
MEIEQLVSRLEEWYTSPRLQGRRQERQLPDGPTASAGKKRHAELSGLLRRLLDLPAHAANSVHHGNLGLAEDLHEARAAPRAGSRDWAPRTQGGRGRVQVEIMGSQKCGIGGKAQSVLYDDQSHYRHSQQLRRFVPRACLPPIRCCRFAMSSTARSREVAAGWRRPRPALPATRNESSRSRGSIAAAACRSHHSRGRWRPRWACAWSCAMLSPARADRQGTISAAAAAAAEAGPSGATNKSCSR